MHATTDLARIARALGGAVRDGKGWRCRCPVHSGADANLSLQPGDAVPLLARCWSHSCDPRKVLAELRHRGLLDEGHDDGRRRVLPQSQPRHVKPASIDSRNVALAISTWNESEADHPILRRYLAGRGLDGGQIDALRLHPRCPRGRDRLPAMVALMRDAVTNEPTGIHRTFIKSDGSSKADVRPAKMMLGRAAGSVVKLTPDEEVTLGLGLSEGVEDGLAIIDAGWRPVWACLSAGGMSSFPVLHGVEALTVFCDADSPGRKAAAAVVRGWREAGIEAVIAEPPEGCKDFGELAHG